MRSERQVPQLWALFASACEALGLPAAGSQAVRLFVRNCSQPAVYFLSLPSASTHTQPDNQCPAQGPESGIAASEAWRNEREQLNTACRHFREAEGSQTACLVVNSALVELLQPAGLRAALVAGLAPAILPSSGMVTPFRLVYFTATLFQK